MGTDKAGKFCKSYLPNISGQTLLLSLSLLYPITLPYLQDGQLLHCPALRPELFGPMCSPDEPVSYRNLSDSGKL